MNEKEIVSPTVDISYEIRDGQNKSIKKHESEATKPSITREQPQTGKQ
jgi:hypothetical protein